MMNFNSQERMEKKMKKSVVKVVVGVLSLALGLGFGANVAFAAPTTSTLVLTGGSATFGLDPAVITATANAAGKVKFTAGGNVITGCDAVATTTEAPFVAKCSWVPAAAGAVALGGSFTPNDPAVATTADAPVLNVKVGVPVQGVISPIHLYVDTVLGSGTSGPLAPRFGVSCAITSEFIVGQTIVFRVYGNNENLGGAVMDSKNTKEAYIEIAGVAKPIPLSYGNHSGVSFWTGVLKTGTGTGLYSTLGLISFKVTMVAKDQDTIQVLSTKLVPRMVDGKKVVENGKDVYDRVAYYKNTKLRTPLKGAVGTWQSNFAQYSQLTLYAVPKAA